MGNNFYRLWNEVNYGRLGFAFFQPLLNGRARPMSSGSEAHQPRTSAKAEPKHWLEYAIFLFVIATAIATGFAAYYTRQQWLTAEDTEKRSLRAYIAISTTIPIKMDSEKIVITMDNFGQTPAKDVVSFSKLDFGDFTPRSIARR